MSSHLDVELNPIPLIGHLTQVVLLIVLASPVNKKHHCKKYKKYGK